jgi:hypothetical protein
MTVAAHPYLGFATPCCDGGEKLFGSGFNLTAHPVELSSAYLASVFTRTVEVGPAAVILRPSFERVILE